MPYAMQASRYSFSFPHAVVCHTEFFWSSSQAWRGEVRIELPSGPTQLTSSPP